MTTLSEVGYINPYVDTFYYHWMTSDNEIVYWDEFDKVQECTKWHAFCYRGCVAATVTCNHDTAGYVGSGEAHTHTEATHLLNTMALNHFACGSSFSKIKVIK